MCGRFERHSNVNKLTELVTGLRLPKHVDVRPSYNIAPSQHILLARNVADSEREWTTMSWGLLPFWAKDLKVNKPINARAETVHEKPYFREAFKRRRCLVPADGYYEWQKTKNGKQPYYITLRQDEPFMFAGLWEKWKPKDGSETIETSCIMTTDANTYAAKIHNRMPVIVEPLHYELWLDPDVDSRGELERILQPYHWVEKMEAWPVDKYVNRPENNDGRCLERVELD